MIKKYLKLCEKHKLNYFPELGENIRFFEKYAKRKSGIAKIIKILNYDDRFGKIRKIGIQ